MGDDGEPDISRRRRGAAATSSTGPWPEPVRYVVYGAGAVGGVIGGHLHLAGLDTTLVARGEHLAAIRRDGLLLDTAEAAQRLEIPAAETAAEVDWTDDTVVLLTVKSHQTAAALDDLAAHAPAGTVVVSRPERRRQRASGAAPLRPGVRRHGDAARHPPRTRRGRAEVLPHARHPRHRPGAGRGRRHGRGDRRRSQRQAGFESVPRPDIMAWKHRKLLMNLGNGVDAAFAEGDAADELARACPRGGRGRARGGRHRRGVGGAGPRASRRHPPPAPGRRPTAGRVDLAEHHPRRRRARSTTSRARWSCSGGCTAFRRPSTSWSSGRPPSWRSPEARPAAATRPKPSPPPGRHDEGPPPNG